MEILIKIFSRKILFLTREEIFLSPVDLVMFYLLYWQNEIVYFSVKGAIYYVTMAKVIFFTCEEIRFSPEMSRGISFHRVCGYLPFGKKFQNSQGKNQMIQQFSGNSIRKLRKERKRRTERREVPFRSERGKSKNCVPFRAYFSRFQSSACARKLIALRIMAALCRCSFCGKKSPTLKTLLWKRAKVKLIAGNC